MNGGGNVRSPLPKMNLSRLQFGKALHNDILVTLRRRRADGFCMLGTALFKRFFELDVEVVACLPQISFFYVVGDGRTIRQRFVDLIREL